MRRIIKYITIGLVVTFFIHGQANALDNAYFDIVKGQAVDYNYDGYYDFITFQVITKSANFDIPVKFVSLGSGLLVHSNDIYREEINKKIDEYKVYLPEGIFAVGGNFSTDITLDISAIAGLNGGEIIDGTPGSGTNETILVIEFP